VAGLRAAGPDLLARHAPAARHLGSPRLHAGRVRSRVRLAEQLTELDLALERRAHQPRELLRGSVLRDRERVPAADAELGAPHARGRELLVDHELLDGARLAAPGPRPVAAAVAPVPERLALL